MVPTLLHWAMVPTLLHWAMVPTLLHRTTWGSCGTSSVVKGHLIVGLSGRDDLTYCRVAVGEKLAGCTHKGTAGCTHKGTAGCTHKGTAGCTHKGTTGDRERLNVKCASCIRAVNKHIYYPYDLNDCTVSAVFTKVSRLYGCHA